MKLIYDNLQGLGGYFASDYWSSSEENVSYAYFQFFIKGYQDFSLKSDLEFYVRPVRAF